MSKQAFSRLDVLRRVQSGGPRISDACVLMGLQRRQVVRLLRGLRQDGPASLLSKRRGKPSNHWPHDEVRALVLSIAREQYVDFGPAPRLRMGRLWRRRSWQSITAVRCRARPCAVG